MSIGISRNEFESSNLSRDNASREIGRMVHQHLHINEQTPDPYHVNPEAYRFIAFTYLQHKGDDVQKLTRVCITA